MNDARNHTLAFVLFKYFSFGGLQRNFMQIAMRCQAQGACVRVYTLAWEGELPRGFELRVVPARGLGNHARYARFNDWVAADLHAHPVDCVIGFNRMPGLDIYFAADPCFEARARTRAFWHRLTPRYRHFAAFERAVFAPQAATHVLVLTAAQQQAFTDCYGTAAARFTQLPPAIAADRYAGADAPRVRSAIRAELGLADNTLLLLQIGSGFRIKGLARSVRALAALPAQLLARTQLLAIGQDKSDAFVRLARRLGIAARVRIEQGRNDVPQLLQGADLLIHPAHAETAGLVLLEAMAAGLPVLTTAACGYAHYIEEANAGRVLAAPFRQQALDATLTAMLVADERPQWRANGIAFAARMPLATMVDAACARIDAQARAAVARAAALGGRGDTGLSHVSAA